MPTFKPLGVKYIILLGPFHANLSNESALVFRLIFRERRVGILCLQLLLYYQNFWSKLHQVASHATLIFAKDLIFIILFLSWSSAKCLFRKFPLHALIKNWTTFMPPETVEKVVVHFLKDSSGTVKLKWMLEFGAI